jgi:hypothetical protein
VKKLIWIAALALAVAVVAPVQAKPPKPGPPKPTPPNKCQPHAVSYEVSGTLNSGSLTLNSDGTYSGTLTVQVKKTNMHAKAAKGTVVTYTLTSARVNLHGATPGALAANSRVKLHGTITTVAKKCTPATPVVTIASGDIKAPKH